MSNFASYVLSASALVNKLNYNSPKILLKTQKLNLVSWISPAAAAQHSDRSEKVRFKPNTLFPVHFLTSNHWETRKYISSRWQIHPDAQRTPTLSVLLCASAWILPFGAQIRHLKSRKKPANKGWDYSYGYEQRCRRESEELLKMNGSMALTDSGVRAPSRPSMNVIITG